MAKLKPDKLLILFDELAEKMDINIVQGKGDFQGGMCHLNDESYIVLNKSFYFIPLNLTIFNPSQQFIKL